MNVLRESRKGYVMFLENNLPLTSYDADFDILSGQRIEEVKLSITLDHGSAEDLLDSGVFPVFSLPEIQPLAIVQVRLNLKAGKAMIDQLQAAYASGKNPVEALVDRPDGAVTIFRLMSSYQLLGWEVSQTQTEPDPYQDLATKEPDPL